MTAASVATPRRRIVFEPKVRAMRILWRLLPWLAFFAIAVLTTWILGASAKGIAHALVVGGIVLAYGLARAVITELFSPDRPGLRIIPVPDGRARRLAGTTRALLFFFLLTSLGAGLVEVNGWHPGVADVLRVVQSVVLVLAAAGLLASTGLLRRFRDAEGDSMRATIRRFAARVFFPLLVVTMLVYVVVEGLGYEPLAHWIGRNAAWSVARILLGVLIFRWLRRALTRTLHFYREDRVAAEGEEASTPEVDTVALGIERIGGGILRLVSIVFVGFWVLQGWNLPPGAVFEALDSPIFGRDGVTWTQMLGGVLSVVGTLYVGWLIRGILTYFVFPKSKIGVGARYAILAMLRYTVVAIAVVLGLGALGMDTSSFGWFFGAAGIGIGFGLQDVIGNFISGLIMLIERPIRVGDWVQIGDQMGTVENIHMRGTVLRTFDRTTVLIPNRQMLGERVTNLTHGMTTARIRIRVGVAYGTDPRKVNRILLDVARANERILVDPEPTVLFDAFGESSLDFILVCFTGEVKSRLGISSELRTEILKRLERAGVEIPFPQRDLHIRSGMPPGPE